MALKAKHKGARNELSAVLWLLDNGYEVFRNVSSAGPIDIIAVKGKEYLLLDAKSSTSFSISPEQVAIGVRFIIPDPVHGWQIVAVPLRPSLEEQLERRRVGIEKAKATRFANVVKLLAPKESSSG